MEKVRKIERGKEKESKIGRKIERGRERERKQNREEKRERVRARKKDYTMSTGTVVQSGCNKKKKFE